MDRYETFLIEYIERSSEGVTRRRPKFYASPKLLNHDKFQSRLDNFAKQKQYKGLDEITRAVENKVLKRENIVHLGGIAKCFDDSIVPSTNRYTAHIYLNSVM